MTSNMIGETQPVLRTDLAGLQIVARGKVRDVYRCDGLLLLIATDRVSAFDVVLPAPIPVGRLGSVPEDLSPWPGPRHRRTLRSVRDSSASGQCFT